LFLARERRPYEKVFSSLKPLEGMSHNASFPRTIIIITTATIAVAVSVYFLTSRKKKVKNVLSRESFISNRNLSWFQLANLGEGNQGLLSSFTSSLTPFISFSHIPTTLTEIIHLNLRLISLSCPFCFTGITDNAEQLHPEGPNIGYNSNSSWFDNKQTTSSDNMQAQNKGNKPPIPLF
jgi:hypothetical protein